MNVDNDAEEDKGDPELGDITLNKEKAAPKLNLGSGLHIPYSSNDGKNSSGGL